MERRVDEPSKALFEQWVGRVRDAYAGGVPNGWDLRWDERRLEAKLSEIVAPGHLENVTDFNYAVCNKYEVAFRPSKAPDEWLLAIRLSFIVDAFEMHWTHYLTKKDGTVEARPPFSDWRHVEERVRGAIRNEGFAEVPAAWHDVPIVGVNLDLAGPSGVTLGKCLFEDYEG